MTSKESDHAKARQAAKSAPKADKDIGEAAIRDAKRLRPDCNKHQKTTVIGENVHLDKDAAVCDFDDT